MISLRVFCLYEYCVCHKKMVIKNASFSSLTELFRPQSGSKRNLSKTRLNALKQEIETNLHLITLAELYTRLGSDPVRGLSSKKAAELLKYYGPNTLTPASEAHWIKVLLKCMFTGFSVLIWFGAILCMAAYLIEINMTSRANKDNLYLGCVLVAVDVICGLFSFAQTHKSSKLMRSFKNMLPSYTKCTRDGLLNTTLVTNLVKGDIVHVEAGDVVPADIRIIDSRGFKVDNSSLTGESVAVTRSNADGQDNILESPNVAFFSTMCMEGWAKGIVICCGDLTALGRVAGLATRIKPLPSPLQREIRSFMRCMSIWAISLGVLMALLALLIGYPFLQVTIFVIGIIVANIPEGLQPTITAALTLTAKRMVSKNCLVKNLDAIEALGACTTICSDKTGTLTKNQMCVRHLWTGNSTYLVDDGQFKSQVKDNNAFTLLKICGSLCSTARTNSAGEILGDASESAILSFLINNGDVRSIRKSYPKVAEIMFNSINKYQVSIHQDSRNSSYYLVMKGAPEIVLARCSTIAMNTGDVTLTDELRRTAEQATDDLASTGERILAFADLVLDKSQYIPGFKFDIEHPNFPLDNLRLLGIMGLKDPPREEVRSSIERVRAAGVRVMMVTGDHPLTARAIAREVGIATTARCHVLTGAQLRDMTRDLLLWNLHKHHEIVFARTSPMQKLQIVEACQRQHDIVAVTGDGVNDAPALRKADIGISMGITGSQVSKQTADMILMDDNFSTIVVGIEEGRKIFDNLKKSVCYILISNVPEIAPVLMFILFSIPLPLDVMTILCIDLGTDMWPAVSLSFEQAESDVMRRTPRVGSLVSRKMLVLAYGHLGIIEFAAGMYAYFVVMAQHGFMPQDLFGIRSRWDNEAITDLKDSFGQEWTYAERKEVEVACQAAYFAAIVLMQITNAIICKTRYNSIFHVGMKNRTLNYGLLFEVVIACFICYTPGVNHFFGTYPLRMQWWFLALPFAVMMFAFDEFRKYCIRRNLFKGWYKDLTFF